MIGERKDYSKIINGEEYFDYDTYFDVCIPKDLGKKKSRSSADTATKDGKKTDETKR